MLFQEGLGLDIAVHRVSVVHLRQTFGAPRIVDQAVWPLEADQPLRAQLERVGALLRGFVEEKRLAGLGAFIGIPQERTLVREIRLPSAVRENLAQTVRYEADRYLPLPEEEVFSDFQLIGEDPEAQELRVLVVAAKRTEIATAMELAEAAGIGVQGIAPSNAAWVNLLSGLNGRSSPPVFHLVSDTPAGVGLTAAENGKLIGWRTLRKTGDGDLAPGELDRALGSFGHGNGDGHGPAPVVVCPPDPDGRLEETTRRSDAGIEVRAVTLEELGVPSWEVLGAYGLAMGGIRKQPSQVNLLPAAMRKRPSRVGLYLVLALAALNVLAGIGWVGSELVRQRLAEHRVEDEIDRLRKKVTAVENLQKDLDATEARAEFLNRIEAERLPVLEVLLELSSAIPESAWLREINISGDRVRIDGYAEAAAKLIPVIDASPRTTDVAFLSAITRGRDGQEKFRIGFRMVGTDRPARNPSAE